MVDELPAGARRRQAWQSARKVVRDAARELIPDVRGSEEALVRWADSTRGVLGRLGQAVRRVAQRTGEEVQSRVEERLERAGDVMTELRARLRPERAAPPQAPPQDARDAARNVIEALRSRLGERR